MFKRSFLALLCASIAAPALAAPAKPAPVSALVREVKIPYQQFTLKNGLRVVVHTDRKAPLIAVSVWYGVGSKHEPKGKTGFAHLFEHLMFNGSENAPGDFFEPLAQIGATDFNGTTFFDRTNYFQTVPKNALDRVLFLESDRMGHLLGAVTQEKLDNQRGVVQNEKRQGDNQPYGMSWYATLAGLFPEGHPYHHSTIGSMADLDAANLEDVRNWFRDNYGPNNAVLVLAGDIDVKTARSAVQKWFGAIPRGPAIKDVVAPVPTLEAAKETILKDRVATTRLTRMWTIPGETNPDATALAAGAAVLGGLSSSRLDNALVRTDKVAASVSASASLFEDVGIYYVSADVLPGVDPAVTGAKLDQVIADFVREGPTADELTRVTTSSISGIISGLESVGGFGGKATTLAEGALYRNNPGAYRADLAELAKLTPARVRDVTKQWLSRPVFTLKTVPGEREGGEGGTPAATKAAPFPQAYFYADPATEAAEKYVETQAGGGARLPKTDGVASIGPDRSKLPDVGEFPALDFPALERATLKNGIPVVFARRDAVPKVQVSVSFDAGFTADPKDGLGTQALMLGVIDEGTATRTSIQIAEESERLGANISKGASLDRTGFSLSALTPNLAPSLALLADIVRNPAFDPKEVDRVRAQQLTAIAAELTRPAALAARVLPGKLFGEAHPYGIPGTGTGDPKVVKTLTPEQLRAFHRRWIRSDNARIIVVGNTTLAEVLPMLDASFGNWPQDRMARPVKSSLDVGAAPKPVIYLIDRPGSPQSIISAGQVLSVRGKDDVVALRAVNDIIGGSFLSRINTDLRETKGWSYGSRTGIAAHEGPLTFTVSAPVQTDKTGPSIAAIREQLTAFLGPKGTTPAELERTLNNNIRELPGSFETAGDVLGGVTNIVNFGRPDDYYETLSAKYRGMDAAALDATARAQIDPSRMVWVVVGDAKSVRPQLDGLGLPVEIIPAPAAE